MLFQLGEVSGAVPYQTCRPLVKVIRDNCADRAEYNCRGDSKRSPGYCCKINLECHDVLLLYGKVSGYCSLIIVIYYIILNVKDYFDLFFSCSLKALCNLTNAENATCA